MDVRAAPDGPRRPRCRRLPHRATVTELIDGFIGAGERDLVTDFAKILPVYAECDLMGVRHRADEVGRLTAEFVQALEEPEKLDGVAPSAMFRYLTTRPELRDQVASDPAALDAAIEETLRLSPPLLQFSRTTTCPTTILGEEIPAGSSVMFIRSAANRDPEVFPEPGEFRLDRPGKPPPELRVRLHRCVGSQLARIEMRIAAQEVLRRMPAVRIAVPEAEAQLYVHGGVELLMNTLPVRFTPGT